ECSQECSRQKPTPPISAKSIREMVRPPSLELGTPGLGNREHGTISLRILRKTRDLYENFMNWRLATQRLSRFIVASKGRAESFAVGVAAGAGWNRDSSTL